MAGWPCCSYACVAPPTTYRRRKLRLSLNRPAPAIYRTACASCHGPDGKGAPRTTVGFETPLPDFTDCSFSTPEADLTGSAVVHQGGPVRAFDRMMPAFGDALSEDESCASSITSADFCTEPGWPRGELNLPRPLVTEKAFPENEAVLTARSRDRRRTTSGNEFLYERRLGRRGQYEIAVPRCWRSQERREWRRGLGDVAVALQARRCIDSLPRGSILSAGGEVVLPTGKESGGLGGGTTIFEPFVTFSQMLPARRVPAPARRRSSVPVADATCAHTEVVLAGGHR